jgi:dipeptidase
MWGAEMGANEHGLAIGNEAVFTRVPYEKTGLTGMDLVRLALERASSAREALDLITWHIGRYGQGGGCGYRHRRFRYHNSFILADPSEAWVLETAGRFWAAQRVRGIRTISNVLTIGADFDLVDEAAIAYARAQRWCRSAGDFSFASCFADPLYSALSGGERRRECTMRFLSGQGRKLERRDFAHALRDHGGISPSSGWRMKMPCAHASWWPTRQAGQTTASMVSRLVRAGSTHWLTGTSSPCISVFKPVVLGGDKIDTGPAPGAGFDPHSLFWRHERLHRVTLTDYAHLSKVFEDQRRDLEARSFELSNAPKAKAKAVSECWEAHRQAVLDWTALVERVERRALTSLFQRYWRRQNREDSLFTNSEQSSNASESDALADNASPAGRPRSRR